MLVSKTGNWWVIMNYLLIGKISIFDTVTVYKTTDARTGLYAVGVFLLDSSAFGDCSNGLLSTGSQYPDVLFPYSGRPTFFSGYYKFFPVGADTMIIQVALTQGSNVLGDGLLYISNAATSTFQNFQIPINYVLPGVSDSAFIFAAAATGNPDTLCDLVGSTLLLDDLSFTDVAVNVLHRNPASHIQVYPNPTDGILNIDFVDMISFPVEIEVVDVNGRIHIRKEIYNNLGAITLDLSHLSRGVYVLQISNTLELPIRRRILLE